MAGARIDYVELPSATAHELTRAFYAKAFGWDFADYGPTYAATTIRARSPPSCGRASHRPGSSASGA